MSRKSKSITKILTVFIFFIIIFSFPVFANEEKIKVGKQMWIDGIYAKYSLKYTLVKSDKTISGNLEFHVVGSKLFVEIYGSEISHKVLKLDVKDDQTYYNGERVVLPFFYKGVQISYYDGEYIKATEIRNITMVTQKGILHGRQALYVEAEAVYREDNKTQSIQNVYEFGKSSHLLFNGFLGYSILINHFFNINNALNIRISLLDTNIELAPPNNSLVFSYYLYMMCPIISIILIFVIFLYLYRRVYSRDKNEHYSHKKSNKKIR